MWRLHLDGTPLGPLCVPRAEVTFGFDANGILDASAPTGKSDQGEADSAQEASEVGGQPCMRCAGLRGRSLLV